MKNTATTIFGTGPLGLWVMQTLHDQGKHVTLVNRSGKLPHTLPENVTIVAGDASDAQVVAQLCKNADVAFHCAMPPYTEWPEKFPSLTQGILDGVSRTGTTLVYGDNLYAYGDPHGKPLTEDLPSAATTRKGAVRASMADTLLTAHVKGRARVAIGRGSDFYGPLVGNSGFGDMFFMAALSGRPANLLGNIDLPHTYTYIRDFARALVTLSEHERALGEVWHVPNPPTLTTRQLVKLVEDEIGQPINVRTAGRFMVGLLGLFRPMLKELHEMMYEWEQPFIVEHRKFTNAFDMQATPHETAVKETVVWYRQRSAMPGTGALSWASSQASSHMEPVS